MKNDFAQHLRTHLFVGDSARTVARTRFRGHPVKVLMEQEAGHGEATVYAGVQG